MSGEKCGRRRCTSSVHGHGLCQTHRRAAVAAGEFESWSLIDSTEARAHVVALNAAGIGYEMLAELSGVSHRTLRRMPDLTRIRQRTADRILAVPVPRAPIAAKTAVRVDPTGTMRRLQALVALGHRQDDLAARLGMIPTNLYRLTRGAQLSVTARRAREVTALFNELQFAPGTSDYSRELAAERGWVSPLAWDDDTIDDPNAKPNLGSARRGGASERIESCTVVGITDSETIAQHLGIEARSVDRQLLRMREAS